MKKALITGISGQDGSYLGEYLLNLGYRVYGLVRRESETMRLLDGIRDRIELLYGDMRDTQSLEVALYKASPDEIYNLAGQVFVPTSWECPAETFDINVGGLARILRIVERQLPETRIYQASSSEMYGNAEGLSNELTPMNPTSPYGTSKLAAHRLVDVYRGRGLYAISGILFNHESPRRGPEMVTRKVTRAAAAWAQGDRTKLKLGNLNARRDWGFAGDYVQAMHAMMQQEKPRDYVIGTGRSHSVREFIQFVLTELEPYLGPAKIEDYVEVDPRLLRTGEIHDLRADAAVARKELDWAPRVGLRELVGMMVQADLAVLRQRNPVLQAVERTSVV